MEIKHVYEITNAISGESLGGYEAADEQGALDALAQEGGYTDHADAVWHDAVPPARQLRVTLQSVVQA